MTAAARRLSCSVAAPATEESLLLDFARRQLAFDRALVAYNRSPETDGPEADALDAAFRALREIRPRLAGVRLDAPRGTRRATA